MCKFHRNDDSRLKKVIYHLQNAKLLKFDTLKSLSLALEIVGALCFTVIFVLTQPA